MRYAVLQTFRTPSHRFHPGMEVDDTDVDGPLPAVDWAGMGFLGDVVPALEDVDALVAEAAAFGIQRGRSSAAHLRAQVNAKKAADEAAEEMRNTPPMRYVVLEGFVTPQHRHPIGAVVMAEDIDGPVPVERWVEMGRLKALADDAPVEPAPVEPEAGPPVDAGRPPERVPVEPSVDPGPPVDAGPPADVPAPPRGRR